MDQVDSVDALDFAPSRKPQAFFLTFRYYHNTVLPREIKPHLLNSPNRLT